MPREAVEPSIVCLSGFGPLEPLAREAGIALHDLAYPRLREGGSIRYGRIPGLLPVPFRFIQHLRRARPTILHTIIPVCNVIGAICGQAARVPCVVCSKVFLSAYRNKPRLLSFAEAVTGPLFDLVHCKSEGIARDVAANEPIRRSVMRVVYNGIDAQEYGVATVPHPLPADLGVMGGGPVIGTVANLHPYKGHLDIVEAMPAVLREFPGARFLFAGRDNGMQERLVRRAVELGVRERLILAGPRADIPRLLQSFTVLLSSSYEEGFSNVLLEGMAAGLPVVATNACGSDESVRNGETGYIVPMRRPDRMADALLDLLRHPARARAMGLAGRERVESQFTLQQTVDGLLAFYREVVSLKRAQDGWL